MKVREQGRVVSQAIVIAIAVKATGEREVLGLDVGPSEEGAFWLAIIAVVIELSRRLILLVATGCGAAAAQPSQNGRCFHATIYYRRSQRAGETSRSYWGRHGRLGRATGFLAK